MKLYKKEIKSAKNKLIIGFDVEWTKNYHIKGGNKPFCFSFVYIEAGADILSLENKLEFGFHSFYVDKESEFKQLCRLANKNAYNLISKGKNILVGHQFTSDLGVLLACGKKVRLTHLKSIRSDWRTRHNAASIKTQKFTVFDTRYDMEINGMSHRLVDVCNEWNLNVMQPELKGSMTKMQRDFYNDGSDIIREKLSVLNIRHSLSSIILYLLYTNKYKPKRSINVNRIIFNNLSGIIGYINGKEFKEML